MFENRSVCQCMNVRFYKNIKGVIFMKLRGKRVISFVIAFVMFFTNCVSTYSVSVAQYEYGSIYVIGARLVNEIVESEANEIVSSAALRLGAVESSYIFASLDDSLITGDVLNTPAS